MHHSSNARRISRSMVLHGGEIDETWFDLDQFIEVRYNVIVCIRFNYEEITNTYFLTITCYPVSGDYGFEIGIRWGWSLQLWGTKHFLPCNIIG
jgi:hypothetical protein